MNTAHKPSTAEAPTLSSSEQAETRRRATEVASYAPLVNRIAMQIFRRVRGQVEFDDLVSWGTTGLLEAMNRYEPTREARLATFAYHRIRGAMLDGIGNVAPLSRKGYRSAAARGDNHAIYYDDCETDDIVDPRGALSPSDFAEGVQLKEVLALAISNLPSQQQQLVRKHYFDDASHKEAGETNGISKSWACRSHAKALKNLRVEMQKVFSCAA